MDKRLRITIAYINLGSVTNKLLFRMKKEPHKKEGIQQQIDDLDQVRNILKDVEAENEALHSKLLELELRALKVEEKLNLLFKRNE